MVTVLLNTHDLNFGSLSWFWRCKEHPCPLSFHFGPWRTLEVPDWGFASCSWFGFGQQSLIHPWFKFWFSIFILKVQSTPMSFKSWLGDLEVTGGSWLGLGILIMIHKGRLLSVKLVLKFSISSAKFQLRYLLCSAQKIWCFRVQLGSGSGLVSAEIS